MESYQMCMCFTRKFKFTEAQPPVDIQEAFTRFTDGGVLMTAEQLLRFLVEFQGEDDAQIFNAEQIIEKITNKRKHALTFDDFVQYLFSDDNPPIVNQVHQDMNAPMSHYFIYTGHNSYLKGNQLSSTCSDEPIVKALKRGVRVIELDLWPNSAKDDVQVYHGRTMTPPVSLVKCLWSIKEHAFSASPYPVVITLEDHLNTPLRVKVAEEATRIFAKMLFRPDSECLKKFPSPDSLKYHIILSTKPPKEYLEAKDSVARGIVSEGDAWGKELQDYKPNSFSVNQIIPLCWQSDINLNEEMLEEEDLSDYDQRSQQLGASEYKRLIGIHAKKNKYGLKESLNVDSDSVSRLSLSEQKLEKAITHHGTDVIRFTQRNILRVYPKGTRFNSSNYNPLNGWLHGAQMVAFNMQGYGRSLWLMQGMFRSNGGCGYVKKPEILLPGDQNNHIFDPKVRLPVKKSLRVNLYMGDGWRLDFKKTHFDNYSPPDFYVKIGIAGAPTDATMQKTKIMEDEWKPIWDKEFMFPLTVPELALLRIEVHEYDRSDKDDFGGQTCLPAWELRPGIRAVPLYNRKGEKYSSVKLLMQFKFV